MKPLLLITTLFLWLSSYAQKVVYPENAYGEKINNIRYFQIVGKINDHFLIFENTKAKHFLRVYTDSMELKKNINLPFLSNRNVYTQFIAFPEFAWLVYVYEKKNTLYCMAVKINADAKLISTPVLLDKTHINVSADKYIYQVIASEDKSKILIFKDKRHLDKIHFSNMIYNDSMHLLHRTDNVIYYNYRKEFFNNFSVNNEGDWIFTKEERPDQQTYPGSNIDSAQLCIQYHTRDTLYYSKLKTGGNRLDALVLKIDNKNDHIVINSLYSFKNNIEGLFSAVWNEKGRNWSAVEVSELGAPIRVLAKANSDNATALNNYYISHVILKKNGGFIVAAEERETRYTTSLPDIPYRSSSFSLYDKYQQNRAQFLGSTQTHLNTRISGADYGSLLVLDTDSSANLQWGNAIQKTQIGDVDFGWFSFATIFLGDNLDFIYNTPYKEKWLITHKSITENGKLIDEPLMQGLRQNYIFMPSEGKQVAAKEFIIPAVYQNNLCFAKIEF